MREADLKGAYLSYSRSRGFELTTNLNRADLRGAKLNRANLRYATLFRANLSEADLRETDLRGAVLRRANLHTTNFQGAHLEGADLSGIPWLLVMKITLQPGVKLKAIRWEVEHEEKTTGRLGAS